VNGEGSVGFSLDIKPGVVLRDSDSTESSGEKSSVDCRFGAYL